MPLSSCRPARISPTLHPVVTLHCPLAAPTDKSASFYVGDSAGRKGDFSAAASDRKFALNVGVDFHTPEVGSPSQLSLGLPVLIQLDCRRNTFLANRPRSTPSPVFTRPPFPSGVRTLFSPPCTHIDISLIRTKPSGPPFVPTSTPLVPPPRSDGKPDLVMFIGYPAMGKTKLYKQHFEPAGYEHVNQDTLKTKAKCLNAVEAALKSGRCVVVGLSFPVLRSKVIKTLTKGEPADNTNRNRKTREDYLDLAEKYGAECRCVLFEGTYELAWHNNLYRAFCLSESVKATEVGLILSTLTLTPTLTIICDAGHDYRHLVHCWRTLHSPLSGLHTRRLRWMRGLRRSRLSSGGLKAERRMCGGMGCGCRLIESGRRLGGYGYLVFCVQIVYMIWYSLEWTLCGLTSHIHTQLMLDEPIGLASKHCETYRV